MGINLSKHRFIICDDGRNSQQRFALDRTFLPPLWLSPERSLFSCRFFTILRLFFKFI